MVIFLEVCLIVRASLGGGGKSPGNMKFVVLWIKLDKAAKSQVRELFLGNVCVSSGESQKSPDAGPLLCSEAIPFLIRITGLAHLPPLPDQALYDLHLIVGLCEILIQLSVPCQLDPLSEFQFLAGRICMKIHKSVRKNLMCISESKPSTVT